MQTVTTLSLESIDNFRNWLYERGRSEQTVKAYSSDLQVLLLDTGLQTIPREEFAATAGRWLTQHKRIVKPKTTGRRLTSVRSFAVWAGWGPILTDYRLPEAPRAVPHPLPEGVEGVRRMIASGRSIYEKALVALLGLEGCRMAEALTIRPSNFNISDMKLEIRGKGEKIRYVPISPEAWTYLQEPVMRAYCAGDDRSIIPFRDRNARGIITTLGLRAKLVRHVSSHDLRATFATEVYNKTKDQKIVQELLGHASGDQTAVYIETTFNQMRDAVQL
jgi:site-specific recombinase XerD